MSQNDHASSPPPPIFGSNVITKDPTGALMLGTPVLPRAAYQNQQVPAPYLFTPPAGFYAAPGAQIATGVPPPQYYYGMPAAYKMPPYAPPPLGVVPGGADRSWIQGEVQPTQAYNPAPEVTADFSENEHKHTDLPFAGNGDAVTHANYYSNRIKHIRGLRRYPNLMRLTVRWNDLEELKGIEEAPYLRWLDISGNNLKNLKGMGRMEHLEWLDAHQNDIESVRGLLAAPNLTWLNLHYNHMKNFDGVEGLPNLRFLDCADNDLKSANGLDRCRNLQEINLASNRLEDVGSILALASLPHLFRINIYYNEFSDSDVERIVAHFRQHKPQCEVITTLEDSRRVGHNVQFDKNSQPSSGSQGCCTIQ